MDVDGKSRVPVILRLNQHKEMSIKTLNFSFDVMIVQDIQEVAQYLELKFQVKMQWKDARVSYYNIKRDDCCCFYNTWSETSWYIFDNILPYNSFECDWLFNQLFQGLLF